MNVAEILIVALLSLLFVLAVIKIIKDKRKADRCKNCPFGCKDSLNCNSNHK